MILRYFFLISFSFIITATSFAQNVPVYDLRNFLNIRGAVSPEFSRDERDVYFRTSITGSSQIWKIGDKGGWPQQVTFFDERVVSFSVCPGKDMIALRKDVGGNEQYQIFLLDLSDYSIERVTHNDNCRYGFAFWAYTEPVFYYSSNERDRKYYDIYTYNYESGEVTMVYKSDFNNFPLKISYDDRYILISRSISNFDNDLILYNIETKAETLIISSLEDDDDLSVSGNVLWLPDSKRFFLTSNANRDFRNIAMYDINKRVFEYIDEMSDYEFMIDRSLLNHDYTLRDVSTDGKYLAYTINVDGEFKLNIIDLESKQIVSTPLNLNSAIVSAFRFSNDSRRAVLNFNTPIENTDVWLFNIENSELNRLTFSSLGGINPDIFVEPQLIKTTSFDGLEISGFLYLPKNHGGVTQLPCIIEIHGGPEAQTIASFNSMIQYFVNQGFAVFAPNVRGSTGFGKSFTMLDNVELRENSVKDIFAFANLLTSTGIIDPDQLIVKGGSYGGYMVLACLTLYPDVFAGGICIVGISNFITFLENTADYRRKNREAEYGSIEDDYEFLVSISPIHRIENIKSPLMLIHGVNDPRVPVGEADQVYEVLKAKGNVIEYLRFEDEGHGLSKLANRLDAYPKMVRFIKEEIIGY